MKQKTTTLYCVKCGHEATLDECYHNEYLKYPCCPECHFDADGEPTGNLERMEPSDE